MSGSSYFETYILYWLNNIKANELKPLSFDRLESTIKNHIIPAIGQYRINELSDSIIQTDLMNPKIKSLSYSSIKKIHDALNACFKYAVNRRDLGYNGKRIEQVNFGQVKGYYMETTKYWSLIYKYQNQKRRNNLRVQYVGG